MANLTKGAIMYLYLVVDPAGGGYDDYDSFIVATTSPDKAKLYNPEGRVYPCNNWNCGGSWSKIPDAIEVTLIGVAAPTLSEGEIVLTSYNAA